MNAASPQPAHGDKCGGKTRSGGKCKLPAGHGTGHPGIGRCDHHGGSTPNHQIHAERVAAEQACARLALPIETTASDALRGELARCNGAVHWLQARVAELTAEELVWGTSERRVKTNPGQGAQAGVPQVEVIQSAKVHPMYQLWCRERDRLVTVAAEMSRLGLEERLVRVSEAQGVQLARVVQAILGDLELSAEQQARVIEIVPRRMRELSA